MNAEQKIINSLFNKPSLSDVGKEEIGDLLKKYPYFSQVQWLLAKQLLGEGEEITGKGIFAFYPLLFQDYLKTEEKKTPVDPPAEETLPVFQPLFAEDYFAYTKTQLPEQVENDKPPTMEQVRSFTGWLKLMKRTSLSSGRVKEDSTPSVPNEEAALKEGPILTESMAAIWLQHGQPEKAMEIYEKLILLNPEKRSYFAAKISAIKEP